MKQSFVPLAEAEPARGKVVVPYSNDQVKDAPSIDPDGELNAEEEETLYSHYGIAYSGSQPDDTAGPRPVRRRLLPASLGKLLLGSAGIGVPSPVPPG